MFEPHTNPEWEAVRAQLHHPDELAKDVDTHLEKQFGYVGKAPESQEFKNGVTADLEFAARGVRQLFDTLEMDQLQHVRVADIKALMDEIADRARVPRVNFPAAKRPSEIDEMLGGRLSEEELFQLSDDLRFIQRGLIDLRDKIKAVAQERHTWQAHSTEHAYEYEAQSRDEADRLALEQARIRVQTIARQTATAATPTTSPVYSQQVAPGVTADLTDMVTSEGLTAHQPEQEQIQSRVEIINPLENPRGFTLQFTRLYRELGMQSWADAVAGAMEKIAALGAHERDFIERELREGCHAVLMPGKRVIKETLREAVENIKPVWYENGQEKTVNATFEWSHIQGLINSKSGPLFVGMPDEPYLFLAFPGDRADEGTFDLTLKDQKAQFQNTKKAYPEYDAMNIPGYLVFQALETRAKLTAARASGRADFQVRPLDYYDGTDESSFTGFLDLPVSGGGVPGGCFNPGGRRLWLGGGGVGAVARNGFRLERRVPLSV